jgi:hypothetical protein
MRAKASLSTINDTATAKTWLVENGYWTSFGEEPWAYGNQESEVGEGEWFFYSDEGELNAPPPTADGNAIFRINSSPAVETYNPNKANGVNQIYFNLSDSAGTDYTTQFTTLAENGGTITMTQGANIATYTSTVPGTFFVESEGGFFIMQTGFATQTVTSDSPFVSGDPITLTFGS